MAITNGYTTLARYKAQHLPSGSTSAADDAVIEILIESASRFIDQECYPRTFYGRTTETHYFDVPEDGRTFFFSDYLLTATTLTNGDATTISATYVDYIPINDRSGSPYYKLELKPSSSITFVAASNGDTRRCISLLGTWGYSSSTPFDIEQACMEITRNAYRRKEGQAGDVLTRITGGGMLIEPQDINSFVLRVLNRYPRELGA